MLVFRESDKMCSICDLTAIMIQLQLVVFMPLNIGSCVEERKRGGGRKFFIT